MATTRALSRSAQSHCASPHRPLASQVTVLFDDRALSFSMPAAATLAELAQRLAIEVASPRRRMISVTVKLSP